MVLTLVSCRPAEPAPGALLQADGTAIYTDGEYTATYAVPGNNGWQPYLRFTVKAGLVVDVCYGAVRGVSERTATTPLANPLPGASREPVEAATLLSDDEEYLERYRLESGTRLTEVMAGLERGLVDRQQLPIVVPLRGTRRLQTVEWVHWFVVLAEAALEAARNGDSAVVSVPNPGPYTAEDSADELGWAGRLTIVFDGNDVVAASFEEVRAEEDGSVRVKSDDADYASRYSAAAELTPAIVNSQLEGQLIDGTVDGVSGATGTSNRFRGLVAQIVAARTPVLLPRHLCPH